VGSQLEELTQFATTDNWELEFCAHGRRPRRRQGRSEGLEASVVALFSGGLDSLCGAVYLADRKERPIFVSHSPPGQNSNLSLIESVWKAYEREPFSTDRAVGFRLEVRERNREGLRAMFQEPTRRTRPVYFLSLACAVALDSQTPAIQMSENGALGLSLPIRADAYGALCSRQAHAHILRCFAGLLNSVAPRSGGWRVYNPFEQMTKGEACLLLLDKTAALAQASISCEYVGRQAAFLWHWKKKHPKARAEIGRGPQCGLCVPCLIRRAALYKAGIEDPDEAYFFCAPRVFDKDRLRMKNQFGDRQRVRPPLYDVAAEHVFFMRRFCERARRMKEFDFVVQYFPELRFLSKTEGQPAAKLRRCHNLIQRLATEMLQFLDSRQ